MPNLSREQVEEQLLEALDFARQQYGSRGFSVDKYIRALKTFTDFIIDGILPDDLKPKRRPVRSETASKVFRKKKA